MGHEPVSLIGRNGMGKTTLCNAIMQMPPGELDGLDPLRRAPSSSGGPSYKVAGAGIGYVPAGPAAVRVAHRRRAPADGARRAAASAAGRRDAVYELFPRLAERKDNGGMQLSGGEQQMLAIGRALLGNPKLLIMDEPSEGLAPAIIEMLIETFRGLAARGPRDPRRRAEPRDGDRRWPTASSSWSPGGSPPRRRRPSWPTTRRPSAAGSACERA